MSAQSDLAVVLRLTEYSETSQIATLFGARHGLLRLIAKGARRSTRTRFAAGLDLLEVGEVTFLPPRGAAGLGTLTEWVQRDATSGVRRDPLRLYGALYVAELVAGLTEEGDPHPGLFEALRGALRALAGTAPPGPTLTGFQAALLRAIGYGPQLAACIDCGRALAPRQPAYYSATAGGLLCRDCEGHHVEKRRVPDGLAGTQPGPGGPAAWFDLLDYHLTHLAGRRFQTAARVAALLGRPA